MRSKQRQRGGDARRRTIDPIAGANRRRRAAQRRQRLRQGRPTSLNGMLRHDDNNTSMEEQVTEIAKNQAQHNLALSLMTAQFRLLRAAITERA